MFFFLFNISQYVFIYIYLIYPIYSMSGIFTNIYLINDPNAGKHTIHGAYGYYYHLLYIYMFCVLMIFNIECSFIIIHHTRLD